MRHRFPISPIVVLVLVSVFARSQMRDFSASSFSPSSPNLDGPNQIITVLTGKVVSEEGLSMTESVTVVLECGNQPYARAHSDAKGDFNLTFAADGLGRGSLRSSSAPSFIDCELYGELPGYRSDHVRLSQRPDGGVMQVGRILLHAVSREPGFSVSVTSLAAPEKAKKSLQKGREEAKKGKWAAAADCFKRAIDEYPRFALAWVELGRTQLQQKRFAEAQESFRQSVAQDSTFLDAYVGLAYLALQQKQWKELAEATERLVEFAPQAPLFWFFNSLASFNLGNAAQAETSIERGLRLDPKHQIPDIEYLYGVILARRRDYRAAAEHIGAYLKLGPGTQNAEAAKKMLIEFQERTQDSIRASR